MLFNSFEFLFVLAGWLLFRTPDLSEAGRWIVEILDFGGYALPIDFPHAGRVAFPMVGLMLAVEWFNRREQFGFARYPRGAPVAVVLRPGLPDLLLFAGIAVLRLLPVLTAMRRFIIRTGAFAAIVVLTLGGICVLEIVAEIRAYGSECVAPAAATVAVVGDSQGIRYLNFFETSFEADCWRDGHHLNAKGAREFTRFLQAALAGRQYGIIPD